MPGFESPSFKKTFRATGSGTPSPQQQPLREWNVDAPPQFDPAAQQQQFDANQMADMEAMVKEARREKNEAVPRVSQPGKQRIEFLINIGSITREVSIGGCVFALRTLKNKETKEAMLATFSNKVATELEASYEIRKQQLARSICKIDGHDLSFVIGSESLEDKLAWIDELEDSVVSKLANEFILLKEEASKQFDIKTEAEAKEVAEDLKK